MGEKRVDESIKISFVLAIYNVETYLEECVESIVSEPGNYEVLLIDDGSTDGSGTICDEYERKFQQISFAVSGSESTPELSISILYFSMCILGSGMA